MLNRRFIIVITFLFISLSFLTGFQRFDDILNKYGVEVLTEVVYMIPHTWKGGRINGKGSNLSEGLYDHAADIIEEALSVYPTSFLQKHLKGIGILDTLSFYNTSYGGTAVYAYDYILIVVRSYSYEHTVGTIHHELNHLLVNKHKFEEEKWSSYNSSTFRYGNGGVEAIMNGQSSTAMTNTDLQRGFVCQYGMSALIEDIATFTEIAIEERGKFANRVKAYPIAMMKYELLKSYYYNLDPYFNEDFWTGKKDAEEYKYASGLEHTVNQRKKYTKLIYDKGEFCQLDNNAWQETENNSISMFSEYDRDEFYIYITEDKTDISIALPINHSQSYIYRDKKWVKFYKMSTEYYYKE